MPSDPQEALSRLARLAEAAEGDEKLLFEHEYLKLALQLEQGLRKAAETELEILAACHEKLLAATRQAYDAIQALTQWVRSAGEERIRLGNEAGQRLARTRTALQELVRSHSSGSQSH